VLHPWPASIPQCPSMSSSLQCNVLKSWPCPNLRSISPDAVFKKTKATLQAGGELFYAHGAMAQKPGFTAIMPWKVGARGKKICANQVSDGLLRLKLRGRRMCRAGFVPEFVLLDSGHQYLALRHNVCAL